MSLITLHQDVGGMNRNAPLIVEASDIVAIKSASESSYGHAVIYTRTGDSFTVHEWPSDIEKMVAKAKPAMGDAELAALAALAQVEAVLMAGDNAARALNGLAPAWAYGHGYMEAGSALRDELFRRGILR